MQPVKITISGRFWDSQLYKGKLYLFDLDGSLRTVDWNAFIASLPVPERCRLAVECAFERSDYLYGSKWDRFYHDSEVRRLLTDKFAALNQQELAVGIAELETFSHEQIDTPFPFAHNESLCYRDRLFVGSQSGMYSADIFEDALRASDLHKLWDAPVSGFDIKNDILALAAGDEGLYRSWSTPRDTSLARANDGPVSVWRHLCNDCSYVSSSILAFGYDSAASLVEFRSPKADAEKTDAELAEELWNSDPIGFVEGSEIFRQHTEGALLWGSRNRMCMAKNGELHVVQYMTTNPRRRSVAKEVRTIRLSEWKGSPVSGDNAVFGAVLEMDNCLVVVRSDNEVETLVGEPTNWRVFPRSKYYVNQLHVIYDDRIEILSYNHDYFVDQKEKAFGEPQIERFKRKG